MHKSGSDMLVVKNLATNPFVAAVIGLIVTSPFFILEWYASSGFPQGFPAGLFSFMWFSSSASVYLLGSLYQDTRGKRRIRPVFIVKAVLLLSLVWGLAGLVMDQWPCFTGVPNCD